MLIYNLSQLVTLQGPSRPRVGAEMQDLGILENAWMLITEGQIEAVGTGEPPQAQDAIDGQRGVVLPGWVDAHTHLVFGGNRVQEYEMRAQGATYQEIAAKGGGIRSTVAQTQAASEDQLFEAGRRHACWFLENGTTTVE